jgi:hypothetical protein
MTSVLGPRCFQDVPLAGEVIYHTGRRPMPSRCALAVPLVRHLRKTFQSYSCPCPGISRSQGCPAYTICCHQSKYFLPATYPCPGRVLAGTLPSCPQGWYTTIFVWRAQLHGCLVSTQEKSTALSTRRQSPRQAKVKTSTSMLKMTSHR